MDFDDKSQEHVLKRTLDFQGVEVLLETLIGKEDPSEIIKQHIDSDVSLLCTFPHSCLSPLLVVNSRTSKHNIVYTSTTL
jgi:hypothetical protein